ncbi:MAG: hypothetical protein LBU64_00255 [Planctomycetota bacterium]|jgi:hypothetical protein|nr:hypothetical protein [Planctomycetota bacterium]
MAIVDLSIGNVTPGMKLAEPLVNSEGTILMPAGIRMTPIFVNRLKKWGFGSIKVEVENDSASVSPGGGAIEAESYRNTMTPEEIRFADYVRAEMSSRFQNMVDNPVMSSLCGVVTRLIINNGSKGVLNSLRDASEGGFP